MHNVDLSSDTRDTTVGQCACHLSVKIINNYWWSIDVHSSRSSFKSFFLCVTLLTNSSVITQLSVKYCVGFTNLQFYMYQISACRRPQCRLKATLFISLLHLYSPAMSTGSSQVGAVLSPPC